MIKKTNTVIIYVHWNNLWTLEHLITSVLKTSDLKCVSVCKVDFYVRKNEEVKTRDIETKMTEKYTRSWSSLSQFIFTTPL